MQPSDFRRGAGVQRSKVRSRRTRATRRWSFKRRELDWRRGRFANKTLKRTEHGEDQPFDLRGGGRPSCHGGIRGEDMSPLIGDQSTRRIVHGLVQVERSVLQILRVGHKGRRYALWKGSAPMRWRHSIDGRLIYGVWGEMKSP